MSRRGAKFHLDPNNLPEETEVKGKVINLKGKRFGRAEVLYRSGSNADNRAMWVCKCDCGTYFIRSGKQLRASKPENVSCGCKQTKNLIRRNQEIAGAEPERMVGKRYGSLVVTQHLGFETLSNGKRRTIFETICDCGNIKQVASVYLRTGEVASCGCTKSIGEANILRILQKNNIFPEQNYKQEILGINYYFDFKVNLADQTYFIEFDGEQHYSTYKEYGWYKNSQELEEGLKDTRRRDQIKNKYCLENNIPLIRIPYTKRDDIQLKDLLVETSQYIVKEVEFNEQNI